MEALAPPVPAHKTDGTNSEGRLTTGGKTFRSRLMPGTGEYRPRASASSSLEGGAR